MTAIERVRTANRLVERVLQNPTGLIDGSIDQGEFAELARAIGIAGQAIGAMAEAQTFPDLRIYEDNLRSLQRQLETVAIRLRELSAESMQERSQLAGAAAWVRRARYLASAD